MAGILAIESDQQRRTLLRRLLREHAQVGVTFVDSVNAAIAVFQKYQPDVILAPTLLSPEDSDRLRSHVLRNADPHVQMLTIPALDMLREPPREERRIFRFFRRRRVELGLQYDPAMAGSQIAETLQRARELRENPVSSRDIQKLLLETPSGLDGVAEFGGVTHLSGITQPVCENPAALIRERRRAERTAQRDCGWTVRMPWGGDVTLVNISRSGLLIESGSRLTLGALLDLRLSAMGMSRIVLAKFVRSEVAHVNSRGVLYHSAAQFDQPLDLVPTRTGITVTPQLLSDLLMTVLSESNAMESRSTRFARGLRGLVGARDVFIRHSSPVSVADGESIYFKVKEDGRSSTILQVVFERHRAPSPTEFALLKAGAAMTAAVLELDQAFNESLPSLEVA